MKQLRQLSIFLVTGVWSFVIAFSASAASPITFTPESGIQFTGGAVTPELLANYLVALDIFLFRLAIVLAALMVTIGGFQWLIAMGNSSKISNAKDTIREAILGLILALTAYILFAQIDTNFVQFKSLALNNVNAKGDCSQFLVKVQCDQSAPYIGKQCYWACVVSEQPDLQIPCCIEPISEGSLDTAQRCTLSRTEVIQYKQKFNQDPICCCDGTQCQYSFKGNNFCDLCMQKYCPNSPGSIFYSDECESAWKLVNPIECQRTLRY